MMEDSKFLERVLPNTGCYSICTVRKGGGFRTAFFSGLDSVKKYVSGLKSQPVDVYFATASLRSKLNRSADNISHKKVFYIDIDTQLGGRTSSKFTNKKDALAAFLAFQTKQGLPTPNIVVDSGYGIHIYWVLQTPIPPNEWLLIAQRIKTACVNGGFPADHVVTADTARIMRLPGMRNYKYSTKGELCSVLLDNGKFTTLKQLKGSKQAVDALSDVGQADPSDLSGGLKPPNVEFLFRDVLPECPTLQKVVDTGGVGNPEPLWHQVLHLLAYCKDGRDYIYTVSEKHTNYSKQGVDKKYATVLATKNSNKYGPTTCKAFSTHTDSLCETCPKLGTIKSPIILGKPKPIASNLPVGYIENDKGTFRRPSAKDIRAGRTNLVPVMPYKVEGFSVGRTTLGESLTVGFIVLIGKNRKHKVSFAQNILNDKRTTANKLSENGVVLSSTQTLEFMNLMNTWTQKMQAAGEVSKVVNNYGWVTNGKFKGFSTNNKIFWEDGTEQVVAMSENILSDQYAPVGELEPWKTAADYIIQQNRPQLVVAVASGFASPLLKMTDVAGVLLSIVSAQSGTGKSSALKVAQSLWGCPVRGINALNDTTNSMAKRLGALQNLPAFWDELRMKDDIDAFIKLVFQLSQGKEKSRLTQTTAMQSMGTWNTLMTAASNESLYEHILNAIRSSNAGLVRVFELPMREKQYINDIGATQRMFKKLDYNYGCAGQIYGKYLAVNHKTVSGMVDKTIITLSKQHKARADERFWVATMASLIVGATTANLCGLTKFDIPRLVRFLRAEFERMRVATNEDIVVGIASAKDILADFLNANGDNIYRVTKIPRYSREKIALPIPPKRFPVMAMVDDQGAVRVNYMGFRDWAYKQKQWHPDVVKALVALGAEKTRRTLTSGLHIDTANIGTVLDISAEAMKAINRTGGTK